MGKLSNEAGTGAYDLEVFLNLRNIATCSRYARVQLGDPVLRNRQNGWRAIEMPVLESNYSFTDEREALTTRINDVTEQDGIWAPETPALQIIEFSRTRGVADQIFEITHEFAPRDTEVFDASVRYRRPALDQ